jgi:hypothetical protein
MTVRVDGNVGSSSAVIDAMREYRNPRSRLQRTYKRGCQLKCIWKRNAHR